MTILNEAAITRYQSIEAGHIFRWLKNGRLTELPHDSSVAGAIADNIINFCRLAQHAEKLNKEKGLVDGFDAENASYFTDIMTRNLNLQRAKKKLEPVKSENLLASTIRVMEAAKSGTEFSNDDLELANSFINWRVIPELPEGCPESQDDD
jgi:hypothetical protein